MIYHVAYFSKAFDIVYIDAFLCDKGHSQGLFYFGFLAFTWANRSVHGSGKWYAKFRSGKFRPEIAFTISTNQFHSPKNDRKGLKLILKMACYWAARKASYKFGFRSSVQKNGLPWEGRQRGLVPTNDVLTNGFI